MAESDPRAEPPALSPAPRILIVTAPYYLDVAGALTAGARAVLARAGAAVEEVAVAGALEIAPAIGFAARTGDYDGYVALGCVIRGETTHYETVCAESARGLTLLGVERRLCIGNGVLTVENHAQAMRRAAPDQLDKGGDAAAACLGLIALDRRFAPRAGPGVAPGDEHILLA